MADPTRSPGSALAGERVAPRRARLEHGHALGQRLADQAGIRVLHIKGIAAEAILPLDETLSAEVDLLVEPDGHARLVRMLQGLRTAEVVDDAGRSSEGHAVEIVSHGLGVSLDVHSHFPGFRADPAAVFDVLHRRSVIVPFASHDCACLDRVGLAVLGVVHAAGNDEGSRAARRARARWALLDPDEVTEAHQLITELRAEGAASTVVDGAGRASRREVALFRAHQRRASPATLWILTVLATPGVRPRLVVARRAVSSRSTVATAPTATEHAGAARRGRVTRALRALLPALREVRALLREGGR